MLRPTKHSHPDRTVVFVSMLIIQRLKKNRIDGYLELINDIKNRVVGGEYLFLPALNLLFALGLIEYRQKNDSIEYIENIDEAI